MDKISLIHKDIVKEVELYKILSVSDVFQRMYGNEFMKKEKSIDFSNFDVKSFNDFIEFLDTKEYVYSDDLKNIGDYLGIKELQNDNRFKIILGNNLIKFKVGNLFLVTLPGSREIIQKIQELKKSVRDNQPIDIRFRLAASKVEFHYTGTHLGIVLRGVAQEESIAVKVKISLCKDAFYID